MTHDFSNAVDFSNMFKGCTKLESVPSFNNLDKILVHENDNPDELFITYLNNVLYGSKHKNTKTVNILTEQHHLYSVIFGKYPELFL
jgi:hypothetical protein